MGEKAKGAEMIVFVCSPYLAVLQGRRKQNEALKQVYAYAKAGSKAVKDMGYTPLSPVLCFRGVFDESIERDRALYGSTCLLRVSQGIMIVNTPYNKYSHGMKKEIELAKQLGLSIYECEYKEQI